MKLHVLAAGLVALALSATGAAAAGKMHKLALHLDENDPAKRSMPPHPARAWGSWRLKGWIFFCGNRAHIAPPE